MSRLDQIHSRENLSLRISPDTYRIHWSVIESTEWWIAMQSPSTNGEKNVVDGPTVSVITTPALPVAVDAAATPSIETQTAPADATVPTDTSTVVDPEAPTTATDASAPVNDEQLAEAAEDREGSDKEQAQDHDGYGDRASEFEEKFVMNNRWMAGLTRDEVETRKVEFRKWIGDAGADREDVVMKD